MVKRYGVFLSFVLISIFCLTLPASAQQACPNPPVAPSKKPNIFNQQQESDLGDIITEQFQRDVRVIDDPEVTAYLQRIGDRLTQRLPAGSPKYQFLLYDLPVANAFSLPGGNRIYVSRKLVGFIRTEDELAGLLGHELGHLVAHQGVITMTQIFKDVLGVTSVSDRADIFDKYNKLLDNARRKPDAFLETRKKEEDEQMVADHIGLFLTSAAGYNPRALIQFWDRFAETKGKTGGFLSDLFGTTKPEERRLREMQNEFSQLPGPCGPASPASSAADLAAWQAAVLGYSGLGHRESIHGVVFKRTLEPPLRGDIRHLRISPNGKYVLAQDDSSIYVLTREPFAFLFRVDAPSGYAATFSADSGTFSFYTSGLRVETWNLADQERTDIHDMVIQDGCFQTQLSPDGKYLACFARGGADLRIYAVATGLPVFERKEFYRAQTFGEALQMIFGNLTDTISNRLLTMRFSPDSRYFVASSHTEVAVAVDLTSMKPVSLPGVIKKYLTSEFVFLGTDRIIGIGSGKFNNAALVRFPSGDPIEEVTLGVQNIEAPAHGFYLLLRPIEKYSLGVMDLETKKIFMADPEAAFDIYDSVAVVAHLNGEIGLKQISTKQEIARVNLPRGPLAPLRAAALSPDMKWLALSEPSRGGVWDLSKNERTFYVRGFDGAYFAPDGSFYADFPKTDDVGRAIGQLTLATHKSVPAYKIEEKHVHQEGAILLVTKPNKKDERISDDVTLDVRDAVSGSTLWTRAFPQDAPRVFVAADSSTVALLWRLSGGSASQEIKANEEIAKRASPVKRDDTNYLIEVLDAHTGKLLGGVAVDTNKGSFTIRDVFAAGNHLAIADSENRVLVYSLNSGLQTGKAFGHAAEASGASGLLAAENEAGHVLLYDLPTMQKRDEMTFTSPIVMMKFSDDGNRLFVLTGAQTAYVFDVTPFAKKGASTAASLQ